MYTDGSQSFASSNSAQVSVTASAGGTQLLPIATSARHVLMITNCDAAATLYIGFGVVPTSSLYNIKLAPGATYSTTNASPDDLITGLSSSGTINVQVYEGK